MKRIFAAAIAALSIAAPASATTIMQTGQSIGREICRGYNAAAPREDRLNVIQTALVSGFFQDPVLAQAAFGNTDLSEAQYDELSYGMLSGMAANCPANLEAISNDMANGF